MTIAELDKIVALTDVESICREIEGRGFRLANPDYVWEFPSSLFSEENADGKIEYIDKNAGLYYEGFFFERVKGFAFIRITVWKIVKKEGEEFKIPMTGKSFLYTNAPVNEEYVREQERLTKCPSCKEEYKKKDMLAWSGKYYCKRCAAVEAITESIWIEE